MLSELQKKKITKFFHMYDVNGDGIINKADFQKIIDNMSHIKGYKQGSSAYEAFANKYFSLWNELEKLADKNSNGEISKDEFLQYNENLIIHKDSFNSVWGELGNYAFQIADSDGDEQITVEEYRDLLTAHNMNPSEAETIFSKLDLNGDGYISKQEFLQIVYDYFTSNEPEAPANWMLGSLLTI